jgi:hypothetical protein
MYETTDSLKYKEEWTGEYHGVRFIIVKWQINNHPIWNYYLMLAVEQIPTEFHKEFILPGKYISFIGGGREHLSYDYFTDFFESMEWHGGITYYNKLLDGEGKLEGVKLGCDYNHYFDEDRIYQYTLKEVLEDVQNSIDKLLILIPKLKVYSYKDGKYKERSEVEI